MKPSPITTRRRPLSPNVQIYRPQLTSVLSILNRITGILLSACAVVLVVWLVAGAWEPQTYAPVQAAIASRIGQVMLFGATFALFASLRRHPPSGLGHRTRIRTSVDLHIGVVRHSCERCAHPCGVGRRRIDGRVEPWTLRTCRICAPPWLVRLASAPPKQGSEPGGWSVFQRSLSCP